MAANMIFATWSNQPCNVHRTVHVINPVEITLNALHQQMKFWLIFMKISGDLDTEQ
jgi:hypothetical protein